MSPLPELKSLELRTLCERFRVRRLDLFGSAVSRQLDEVHDLDFLVEFEPLAPGAAFDAYFGLLQGLERLYGKPIDLVMVSAIENPFFREEVERTKAMLYARSA